MYGHASLEASLRLVEAGIVLETEAVWFFSNTGWELVQRYAPHPVNKHYLPAPSMAEVWRELPESKILLRQTEIYMETHWDCDEHNGKDWEEKDVLDIYRNTDALIDLLIWVRKEVKCTLVDMPLSRRMEIEEEGWKESDHE